MKELVKPNESERKYTVDEMVTLLCENRSCYCQGQDCYRNRSTEDFDDEILF